MATNKTTSYSDWSKKTGNNYYEDFLWYVFDNIYRVGQTDAKGKPITRESVMKELNQGSHNVTDVESAVNLGISKGYQNANSSEKALSDWYDRYTKGIEDNAITPQQETETTEAGVGAAEDNTTPNTTYAPAEERDVNQTISQITDEETANNLAQQIASADEGQATNAEDAQAKAKAARLSAANAGLGNTRAGLLGSLTGSNENNGQTYAAANRNLQQSTQNDYLNKMGQAEALDMQAENMRKGATLNAVSGGLQGAASGAMAGFVISDENCKEKPESNNIDEDKLKEQINQFKILYKRVKELRSKK